MKKIETKIVINAPIDFVWNALMDFENHPNWNPFIKHISGNTSKNSKLQVHISPDGNKLFKFNPVVISNQPPFEFKWLGKFLVKGLFDGEHYFMLNKMNEKETLLTHGENFSGIFIYLSSNMLKDTEKGFEKMNIALKKYCERQFLNE
ncbi:SRPBCC family protein [Flavobacterium sp.]|jgi:hypothetical protein|uniref:SRPBCC family protein n=1 Tax=Flavobacterium sp. TaxID=239 RepID=UPI0037BEEE07